jgi:hypothetical protein
MRMSMMVSRKMSIDNTGVLFLGDFDDLKKRRQEERGLPMSEPGTTT